MSILVTIPVHLPFRFPGFNIERNIINIYSGFLCDMSWDKPKLIADSNLVSGIELRQTFYEKISNLLLKISCDRIYENFIMSNLEVSCPQHEKLLT